MTADDQQLRAWQLRSMEILQTLISTEPGLPVMIWTIGPLGITGDPYGAHTDRLEAFDTWADALGATRWDPTITDDMTALRASVKNYNGSGTSIIVRTTLYDDDV